MTSAADQMRVALVARNWIGLTAHLDQHKGKFQLGEGTDLVGNRTGVWVAEIVNDSGTFICTADNPDRALESVLQAVGAT